MVVLDTDIVSLLRRIDRHPALAAWAGRVNDDDVNITVITLGEIERGIERQRRRNPPFAAELAVWARGIENVFADRVLAFDRAAAVIWGRLTAERGYESSDLLIAAIALSRDAAVVTRNVADFAPTGARVEDPFAG